MSMASSCVLLVVCSVSEANEELKYPERIDVPKEVSMHKTILIKEDDGREANISYSPFITYIRGHMLGWRQCSEDAVNMGFSVTQLTSSEVTARCIVKCRTPEFSKGIIQGYNDCQESIRLLKRRNVGEEQLRRSIGESEILKSRIRIDVY